MEVQGIARTAVDHRTHLGVALCVHEGLGRRAGENKQPQNEGRAKWSGKLELSGGQQVPRY